MSQEAIVQVMERASTDAAFRAQLERNPASVLADYDLTAEERADLLRADPRQLQALGVDARISKQADTSGPGIVTTGPFDNTPFSG